MPNSVRQKQIGHRLHPAACSTIKGAQRATPGLFTMPSGCHKPKGPLSTCTSARVLRGSCLHPENALSKAALECIFAYKPAYLNATQGHHDALRALLNEDTFRDSLLGLASSLGSSSPRAE